MPFFAQTINEEEFEEEINDLPKDAIENDKPQYLLTDKTKKSTVKPYKNDSSESLAVNDSKKIYGIYIKKSKNIINSVLRYQATHVHLLNYAIGLTITSKKMKL